MGKVNSYGLHTVTLLPGRDEPMVGLVPTNRLSEAELTHPLEP